MAAFRFFDPWAALDNAAAAAAAAKLANPAKPDIRQPAALAELAALAGSPPEQLFSRAPSKAPIPQPTDGALATWGEIEEERAAIVEYDGGIPRGWAEGFARLDPEGPPATIRPEHWSAFVGAARRFLDTWATKAADLGWTDLDLFSADSCHPEIAWLNSGLLWALPNHNIIDLRADRVILRTPNGSPQTFYRTPHLRARALPWEIAYSGRSA